MRTHHLLIALLSLALAAGVAACGSDDESSSSGNQSSAEGGLKGSISIDGSSTVYPFAQAAAELFNEENPDVKISVGQSGTGGGFEKFCAGETDVSNASRPIKDDEEAPVCEKDGVEYSEVQIANDGIAVVTNKDLKVDSLTTEQLKEVWNKGSKVSSLKDVDPSLPDEKLSLYGPGTDSGTFDFFTDEINGEEGVTRESYEASEDDNQLVTGVSQDAGGLGYFGFSYYEAERGQAQPRRHLRRRRRLRQAELGDDPGRHLQAALAPAVHVPEREGHAAPRGQGASWTSCSPTRPRSPRRPRSCR